VTAGRTSLVGKICVPAFVGWLRSACAARLETAVKPSASTLPKSSSIQLQERRSVYPPVADAASCHTTL
jgi:hypothetical protein